MEKLILRQVNLFMPPPLGISKPIDFNPTCHLRIAEERIDENEVDLAK